MGGFFIGAIKNTLTKQIARRLWIAHYFLVKHRGQNKLSKHLLLQYGPTFSDYCKIENAYWSHIHGVSIERAALERFEKILIACKKPIHGQSFFDKTFSRHMKKSVVAPSVVFESYDYEILGSEADSEYKALFLDVYQGNQIRCSKMPGLLIANSYAIERITDKKINITKDVIVRVSVDFADKSGFGLIDCANFDLLPDKKDINKE